MGMLKWFAAYMAARHLLKPARPQPVDIHLRVELPDESGGQDTVPNIALQQSPEPRPLTEREEREYKRTADREFWRTLENRSGS